MHYNPAESSQQPGPLFMLIVDGIFIFLFLQGQSDLCHYCLLKTFRQATMVIICFADVLLLTVRKDNNRRRWGKVLQFKNHHNRKFKVNKCRPTNILAKRLDFKFCSIKPSLLFYIVGPLCFCRIWLETSQ